MHHLIRILVSSMFICGLSVPASAAVVPFTGRIEVFIGTFPGLPIPGAGLMTLNGSAGTTKPITHLSVPGGAFATALTIPFPNIFPVVQIKISAVNNPVVSFSSGAAPCGTPHPFVTCSGGALIHGRSGLAGAVFLGVFGTAGSPGAIITVPLGVVGAGSMFNVSNSVTVTLMLSGAGWTTGTATVINPTGATATSTTPGGGTGHHDVPTTQTRMGGQNTLNAPNGQIVLVSPLQVYGNVFGVYVPSFVVWTLDYTKPVVPEPGVLLLLGSGVAGLVIYGRRKLGR